MANHYLRNADSTRIYRVVYQTDPEDGGINVMGAYVCATGEAAVLPDGSPIQSPDQPVDAATVLIDSVVNGLTNTNLTAYRTLAKAMIDASWASG